MEWALVNWLYIGAEAVVWAKGEGREVLRGCWIRWTSSSRSLTDLNAPDVPVGPFLVALFAARARARVSACKSLRHLGDLGFEFFDSERPRSGRPHNPYAPNTLRSTPDWPRGVQPRGGGGVLGTLATGRSLAAAGAYRCRPCPPGAFGLCGSAHPTAHLDLSNAPAPPSAKGPTPAHGDVGRGHRQLGGARRSALVF